MNIEFDDGTPDPVTGDPLEGRMLDSVKEAVENALKLCQANGFAHDLGPIASVTVIDVSDPSILPNV